jgi:hypothetical protein
MWNPLSWVMELAAIMAIVLANGGVRNLKIYIRGKSTFLLLSSDWQFLQIVRNNRGSLRIGKTSLESSFS